MLDGLKALLDKVRADLDWIDNRVPGYVKAMIPPYNVIMSNLLVITQVLSMLVEGKGSPEDLRAAAQLLEQFAAEAPALADFLNQLQVKGRTNVWTDPDAHTLYAQACDAQKPPYDDLAAGARAIADGLSGDATVIEDYEDKVWAAVSDLVIADLALVGATITLVLAAAEAASVVAAPAAIPTLVAAAIAFVTAGLKFYSLATQLDVIRSMQAPSISTAAITRVWPQPVLW